MLLNYQFCMNIIWSQFVSSALWSSPDTSFFGKLFLSLNSRLVDIVFRWGSLPRVPGRCFLLFLPAFSSRQISSSPVASPVSLLPVSLLPPKVGLQRCYRFLVLLRESKADISLLPDLPSRSVRAGSLCCSYFSAAEVRWAGRWKVGGSKRCPRPTRLCSLPRGHPLPSASVYSILEGTPCLHIAPQFKGAMWVFVPIRSVVCFSPVTSLPSSLGDWPGSQSRNRAPPPLPTHLIALEICLRIHGFL